MSGVGSSGNPADDGLDHGTTDLPVLDWEGLQRRMGPFGDLADRVLAVSRRQLGELAQQIATQIQSGDPRVKDAIHTLKGVCLNIGAARSSRLMECLETFLEAGLQDAFQEGAQRIPLEIQAVDQEIAKGIPWRSS